MIRANKYGQTEEEVALELTPEEAAMEGKIKVSQGHWAVWTRQPGVLVVSLEE